MGIMGTQNVSTGPAATPEQVAARRELLNRRVRLDLRSAVWEASQVMSYDEIRQFVETTIAEIVSDEP